MSAFPHLSIHVDRWLSKLHHLSPEEHGVYFLALLHMWQEPDCGMPNDPEWLRKRLKIHPARWRRLWSFLLTYMTEIDGRLYQKTLSEERVYCLEKSEKGRSNAVKRWETFRANLLTNNNTSYATQHPKTYAPTPTPTYKKEERKISTGIQQIINSSINRKGFSLPKPDYNDPSVRKARWQQKIEAEIRRRLPERNAELIITGYANGEQEAVEFYETVDASVKSKRARLTDGLRSVTAARQAAKVSEETTDISARRVENGAGARSR